MLLKIQKRYEKIRSAAAASGIVLCFALLLTVHAQLEGLFDTRAVEQTMKQDFRLSSRDMKVLRPFIIGESKSMLQILSECKDRCEESYMRLWNKVLASRREFESSRLNGLAPRQQTALRAVRLKFEKMVLEQLVDDYTDQLGDYLELDWIQVNLVAKVFAAEYRKRLKLLEGTASNNAEIDLKWRAITNERDKRLELILSPQQWQDYLELTNQIDKMLS